MPAWTSGDCFGVHSLSPRRRQVRRGLGPRRYGRSDESDRAGRGTVDPPPLTANAPSTPAAVPIALGDGGRGRVIGSRSDARGSAFHGFRLAPILVLGCQILCDFYTCTTGSKRLAAHNFMELWARSTVPKSGTRSGIDRSDCLGCPNRLSVAVCFRPTLRSGAQTSATWPRFPP